MSTFEKIDRLLRDADKLLIEAADLAQEKSIHRLENQIADVGHRLVKIYDKTHRIIEREKKDNTETLRLLKLGRCVLI